MSLPVIRKILFTVSFPPGNGHRTHVPANRLRLLIKKQLSDLEVIETIDHLFVCRRCLEQYRWIRSSYANGWK